MANLITEKQKKIVKTDYVIRLSSLSLLIASLLGVFLLAYVIPYYISISKKSIKISDQLSSVIEVENKENVGLSVNQVVNQTLNEMKAVELYGKGSPIPSIYFNKVIENKNSSIQITKLSFNFLKEKEGQIFVSGISKDRVGLVAFIEDLKTKGGFASVESPISDFAKDRDISFTLSIKISI